MSSSPRLRKELITRGNVFPLMGDDFRSARTGELLIEHDAMVKDWVKRGYRVVDGHPVCDMEPDGETIKILTVVYRPNPFFPDDDWRS